MDILEIMRARHSVRQYEDKPIPAEIREKLDACIAECNEAAGLNIQILYDEPKCFDSAMAHYGKFSGVSNYICLIGKKGPALDEICGYYGEKIVLLAQELGLNTCWVALTHGKIAATIGTGEKCACIISIGYGKNQGVAHKDRPLSEVCEAPANQPDWFTRGMEAVMLAPTAVNQQKFKFTLQGDTVTARAGFGPYAKMDLGIVKYHFEMASGVKVK